MAYDKAVIQLGKPAYRLNFQNGRSKVSLL